MGPNGWLPITEYAGKYNVSISTLRRRIKTGGIEYSFGDGKYLIKDAPMTASPRNQSMEPLPTVAPPQRANGSASAPQLHTSASQDDDGSPILATANRILSELKKAYSLILQEKEEQIRQLREEIADLSTLVKVLEADNERLRQAQRTELSWDV